MSNLLPSPYGRPRLMLLGVEPCDYPAVVITAYTVTDGAGHLVAGANSKAEGEAIAARFQARYPSRKFYVS